jgi:predicted glycogen debranching enzyme
MLRKNKIGLQPYSKAIQYEWLESNGLGGWSSSTILGCNTRRYHGVLVAATNPPVGRMNLVSKLDESLLVDGRAYDLGVNDYGDGASGNNNQYLNYFERGLFPEWEFEVAGTRIKKTIAMVHGENTTVILYKVLQADRECTLLLLPLLAVRDYHSLTHENGAAREDSEFSGDIFRARLYEETPDIYIKAPGAAFMPRPDWYRNVNLEMEKSRGLDYVEDLFTPGSFTRVLHQGEEWGVVLSTENPAGKDALGLFQQEMSRKERILHQPFNAFTLQHLLLAADQFIVERGEAWRTVIAGYHWFTDWGRDTMISLPGLALYTGRFDDAKKILFAFAQSVSMGMLPTRFADKEGAPEYNNADGTLWYFIAVYRYLYVTNDRLFVLGELLPVLSQIIAWHFAGTRYHIHVEEDGLLFAGEPGQQLTWMDAKIGDWVVTPRMGKPVEIQALWYNALRIFGELLKLNDQQEEALEAGSRAKKAKDSFGEVFWDAEKNCLYDVIDEWGRPLSQVRPNQVFAISLPFPLIEGDQALAALQTIERKLYTPVGLKSLASDEPGYCGKYEGNTYQRDFAYHQGTVWSWLLGPYVDAVMRVEDSPWKAREVISNLRYHLGEACLGTISEIFDGDPPHYPRGCIAQAWSVGEILRVIKEYGLY